MSLKMNEYIKRYTAKYNRPAIENGQPTLHFTEGLVKIAEHHLKTSIGVEVHHKSDLLFIKAELL